MHGQLTSNTYLKSVTLQKQSVEKSVNLHGFK